MSGELRWEWRVRLLAICRGVGISGTILLNLMWPAAIESEAASPQHIDQGSKWSAANRARYYDLDQGSEIIPLAWLQALRQPDGKPFLDDDLKRFGYLGNKEGRTGLPVGFTLAGAKEQQTVGMTCSACHARQITVGDKTYAIDGAPAFADYGAFIVALDAAVLQVLRTDDDFRSFGKAILGPFDPPSLGKLRADVELWSMRMHTLVTRAVPTDKPWGPARLDAMGLIYDSIVGTDIGPPPTYLIPENIIRVDAPSRYPFLWNAPVQDLAQWGGFAKNGNDDYALARNLGQVYGVFATFHPRPAPKSELNVDYLSGNSANLAGLKEAEALIRRLGPPAWPWSVDARLATRGAEVFNRPTVRGGCVECHGITAGFDRGQGPTWRTPVMDVGTDAREWTILLRSAKTGSLAGAHIPGYLGPLKANEQAIDILKLAVVGAMQGYAAQEASKEPLPAGRSQFAIAKQASMATETEAIVIGGYEARVLQGVWSIAPYLHNGSVPTLADLLTSPALRAKQFKIGPAYDIKAVGLAIDQPTTDYTLHTTGCEDRNSGDSRCGHDYGTNLQPEEKQALLEYLKTL